MPRRADRTDPHGASTAQGQRQQQAPAHSLLVKQVNSSKPDPEEMGRMHRLLVEQDSRSGTGSWPARTTSWMRGTRQWVQRTGTVTRDYSIGTSKGPGRTGSRRTATCSARVSALGMQITAGSTARSGTSATDQLPRRPRFRFGGPGFTGCLRSFGPRRSRIRTGRSSAPPAGRPARPSPAQAGSAFRCQRRGGTRSTGRTGSDPA